MRYRAFLLFMILAAMSGCAQVIWYDGAHPSKQVGRDVVIRGTFRGPGVEADYVKVSGEPVYLENAFFDAIDRPAYGSEVEVRGVLKFRSYRGIIGQHPADYYYLDGGLLRVLRAAKGDSYAGTK